MELRVLRYFLTVAREGSVTGAANFLHVTQPTLSRQIKELEEELGVRLLVRHSHSVTLTTEGMRLRKRAEEILDMVEKTEAEFGAGERAIAGEVHIGGGETKGMLLIADVITAMRKKYPDIRYHLFSGNATDVAERLDKGLLDFGVFIQPADLSAYEYLDLPATDSWGVIMRRDNPLAGKAAISRRDLRTEPLLLSRRAVQPGTLKSAISHWFGTYFEQLHVVATYNLIYNAALMVERGVGCALSIDGLVNTTSADGLCFRPLAPALETGLNLAWKRYQVFSPAAQVFFTHIQDAFGRR